MKIMTERKDESLKNWNSFGSLEVNVKKKILLDDPLQNGVQSEPLLGPTKSWKDLRGGRRVWIAAKRFHILERPNRKTLETENGRWISVFLFKQAMEI
jgi:hypothetical protein